MPTLILLLLAAGDLDSELAELARDLPARDRALVDKRILATKKPPPGLTDAQKADLAASKRAFTLEADEGVTELKSRFHSTALMNTPEAKALRAALEAKKKERFAALEVDRLSLLAANKAAADEERKKDLLRLIHRLRGYAGKVDGRDDREEVPAGTTAGPGHLHVPDRFDAIGAMPAEDCTCSHIGNRLVLTAAHCFFRGDETVAQFDVPCPAPATKIQWGRRADGVATATSTCARLVAAEKSDTRDYALLRVDKAPLSKLDVQLTPRPALGGKIAVIGYPSGKNLSAAPPCVVTARPDAPDQIGHACDTSGGNSGGPVLDAVTNTQIAIHNGGRSGNPYPDGGFAADNWATLLGMDPLATCLADAGFH